MAQYKTSGTTIDYTATDVMISGDVVIVGGYIAVIIADLEAGETGGAYVAGIFSFATDSNLSAGDDAHYNATNNKITDDKTDIYAGKVVRDADENTVLVSINFLGSDGGVINTSGSTIGFFGVDPVAQADNIANATGGATQIAKDPQSRDAVNSVLALLSSYGLMSDF